jgi:hypothetical protein
MDNQTPFFVTFCWYLNVIKLSWVAALLRWSAFRVLGDRVEYHHYDMPDTVFYRGWFESKHLGVLAFTRLDGSLSFKW